MDQQIDDYNKRQELDFMRICNHLAKLIDDELPEAESKVWHGSPVWFIDGNLSQDTAR